MLNTKMIAIVALLAVAGVLGAAAQGKDAYVAKKAGCDQQADAKAFGVHQYQRHRYVVRCVAGLSH